MKQLPRPTMSIVPPLPDGWHRRSFQVLSGSRLAVVGTDADLHTALQSNETVGEALRLARQAEAKVWSVQGDELVECVQFALLRLYTIVEQFPDGRWLVANGHSDGEKNARVFGAGGAEERRFELGNGICHIKIDEESRIWVGWLDEGVFGNEGWWMPGLEWAPSAYGIAAFDDRGALLMHATLQPTPECDALNVFGAEVWACTDASRPALWQLQSGSERVWRTDLHGTQAIAVSHPYILAAGGYGEDANRVVLLRLHEQAARMLGEWRLPFGAGFPPEVGLIDGRGDELHVVHGQDWYRWRVGEFVEACE